jgi:drug/metabolite transporter (DMT)-like permease
MLMDASWLWIPIVVAAAASQSVRNAAQRNLVKTAGVMAATFVRFFYGLPFAAIGLVVALVASAAPLPAPNLPYVAWVAFGAVAQLAATALLIAAMSERSFVVAIAYSKTDVVQLGIYSVLLLGERLSLPAITAIAMATVGVLLLSIKPGQGRALQQGSYWSTGAALGLASGAALALCSVAYRAATLALEGALPWVAGIYAVVWAQTIQTLLLGAWLAARDRRGLVQSLIEWRTSTIAGLAGAIASMAWFTAYAMRSAVDVRIVGLVEMVFSYALSRRFFGENVSRVEVAGIVLVVAGIVVISVAGRM